MSLAWPIALNAILMQSMLIIDTLLVSPLGELPLAAMGIASTLIAFILGVQFALANGTQMVIARAFGAESNSALAKGLVTGVVINILVAILFLALLLLSSEQIIALLTDDKILAVQVESYLSICQYIIILTAFTQVFTSYFNGIGESKVPFTGYLLELPFNGIVSYVLIFGLQIPSFKISTFQPLSFQGIGFEGAAMGSVLAVGLRFVFLIWQLYKQNIVRYLNLKQSTFINDCKEHFCEIYPIAINFTILSIGNTVYLLLFSQLTIYAYVAVTLIFPWIRIGTQFINAWAQATAISISQAMGKKQIELIKPIINSSIVVGIIASLFIALAFYLLSLSISFIYPEIQKDTYYALGNIASLYIALPIVRTFNTISGHSLRALGKSIAVLKIHFCMQWLVMLPSCALIVLYFKLSIFWAFSCLIIEELMKAVPFYIMLNKVRR